MKKKSCLFSNHNNCIICAADTFFSNLFYIGISIIGIKAIIVCFVLCSLITLPKGLETFLLYSAGLLNLVLLFKNFNHETTSKESNDNIF